MQTPKGHLVAIGGKEDKGEDSPEHLESNHLRFKSEGVLNDIRDLMPKKDPVIEIITTASSIPEEYFNDYKSAFKKLGVTAKHLPVQTREEAEQPKTLQRLAQCNGVMITGGDQTRLTSILGGTTFLTQLKEQYMHHHFVIGGTSAGATCMSDLMIESGSSERGNIKGEIKVNIGLGFMEGVIIDTHFDTRSRFNRLAEALASQPGIIGIGLSEDTGVIIEHGNVLKAIGSDSVTVLDGSNITYTNIADVKEGKPVTIARIEVYLISRFDHYDLNKRMFTPAPAKEKME